MSSNYARIASGFLAVVVIIATLCVLGYGVTTTVVPKLGGDYIDISLAISSALALLFGICCLVFTYKTTTMPTVSRVAIGLLGTISVSGFVFFYTVLNYSSWEAWI